MYFIMLRLGTHDRCFFFISNIFRPSYMNQKAELATAKRSHSKMYKISIILVMKIISHKIICTPAISITVYFYQYHCFNSKCPYFTSKNWFVYSVDTADHVVSYLSICPSVSTGDHSVQRDRRIFIVWSLINLTLLSDLINLTLFSTPPSYPRIVRKKNNSKINYS